MNIEPYMLVVLYFLIFLAGFIDSIAGGGGLISLPAYLFIGLPPHNAMATNKLSASIGTTTSVIRFFKNKVVDLRVSIISAVGSFISAYIASRIVLILDEKVFKTMVIIVLPIVAIIILSKRDFGNENLSDEIPRNKAYKLAFLIGLFIGFYDGLIGPGTGTFAIMAYCLIMKYDLKTASGNAKVLNFASNYASLAAFIFTDKIMFGIAIPAAIFGIIGNYLGSGFVITKGSKFIRPIMIIVIVLLFSKIFYDVFGMYFS